MDNELKFSDIMDARERLAKTTHPTSFLRSKTFSEACDCDVFLKTENMQKTGSFKVRGAYNKLAKLKNEGQITTVVTASAGNHAQGVAYAANEMGIKAIIVMPKSTPIAKISATKT